VGLRDGQRDKLGDVLMLTLLLAMLTAVSTGMHWHVQWQPQADQYAIVAVTECKQSHFYAYDEFPLVDDLGQDEADIRRQRTPKGERCTVRISVIVSADSGLTEAVSGESTVVIQED
jgi:hypothetical protein